MLRRTIYRFFSIFFGSVLIPSLDIFRVTLIRDMAIYFVDEELIVVAIVRRMPLSQRKFPAVLSVTIDAVSLFQAGCFGCKINIDGVLNNIFEYCQGFYHVL